MKAEGRRGSTEGKRPDAQGRGGARYTVAIVATIVNSSIILHPSSLVWAAHPFLTDDTGTQGAGNWQLELQAERGTLDRTANVGGVPVQQESRVTVFTPVLTYGALENLDRALGLNYARQRTTDNGVVVAESDGMADSIVDIKSILVGTTFRW